MKKYSVEKIIFILLAIKLGIALLIMQTGENNNAAISFGAPAYAQEKEAIDKKMTKKNEVSEGKKSTQIDLEILKSIERKEQDLKKREENLNNQEEQLKILRTEVDRKLGEIKKSQSRIERLVALREDLVEKSIKHLVKVYSSMRPEEAGPLIEKLDRDITIQILSKMKGKNAGKILARVDSTLAAQLSEEIAKRK